MSQGEKTGYPKSDFDKSTLFIGRAQKKFHTPLTIITADSRVI